MRIGIMGAMPEEISATAALLTGSRTESHGGRKYTLGSIAGHEVVCVHARIGKVAASIAATELVTRYRVERLLFTGLAGAVAPDLHVGDVVVADGLFQHDIDASPLFPPLEVPLTGVSRFATTPAIADALQRAARDTLADIGSALALADRLPPRVLRGDIATGDRFIASGEARADILARVPNALCVEMEGAAVAQVCHDYGVPFGVMRVISDHADGSAADDFFQALKSPAASLAAGVIQRVLQGWAPESRDMQSVTPA